MIRQGRAQTGKRIRTENTYKDGSQENNSPFGKRKNRIVFYTDVGVVFDL